MSRAGGTEIELTYCPNGPLLVRGVEAVRDGDGNRHEVTRPVVAVCLCGKSSRRPWCDGTHKLIPKPVERAAQAEGQAG